MAGINYLSHPDFVKVIQWTLLEAVNGSYFEQLARHDANIQATKDFYGFLPRGAYDEKRNFQREWARYALYARHVCVDVETGDTYTPC